jgi:hypothetical protein
MRLAGIGTAGAAARISAILIGLSFALSSAAFAQLKVTPQPTACVKLSEHEYHSILAQECEHLALTPAYESVLNDRLRACVDSPFWFGHAEYKGTNVITWLSANREQRNRICLDAVDALQKNPMHFNGFLRYKP